MIYFDFVHAESGPVEDYAQKQLLNYFHLLLKEEKTERHIPVEFTFGFPIPDLAVPFWTINIKSSPHLIV